MHFGTVTYSEWDAEGFLGIQIDAQGDGGASTSEVAHSFGFLGRPHDPDANGPGCSVELREWGSEEFAWIGHDPRSVAWLPRVTKGGSAQYGGLLAKSLTWREIDGTTGSITDYVPVEWGSDGTATKAHKLEIGVDGAGAQVCQLIHADTSYFGLFDGAATMAAAGGSVYVAAATDGIQLNGATKVVGGLDVGGSGGVEVPLHPALAAAFNTFASTVSGLPTGSTDGGALLKTGLATACGVLASAIAAAKSTQLKTI